MDTGLIKLFQQTGFSEKEARIYLALLELGKGDVSEIAKIAELKRPIVYVIIDELTEKGFVSKLPDKKVNTYQAIDPGVILTQFKAIGKSFSEMLPYLRSLSEKSEKKPKIHFIDTKEGILKIYAEMNECPKQFFISSYSRIEKIFPGAINQWITGYKKGYYSSIGRHLIPDSPKDLERTKEFLEINQKIRALKYFTEVTIDFAVYGNKLGITSLEEKPFMVVIESQSLVDSLMPIFEIAWQSAREIK